MRLTTAPDGALEIRPDATGARRAIIATIPRAYTSPDTLRELAQLLTDYASHVDALRARDIAQLIEELAP